MKINVLRDALKRATALFEVSGAKTQAEATSSVEKLLADCKDESVEEFVARTNEALGAPPLESGRSALRHQGRQDPIRQTLRKDAGSEFQER